MSAVEKVQSSLDSSVHQAAWSVGSAEGQAGPEDAAWTGSFPSNSHGGVV